MIIQHCSPIKGHRFAEAVIATIAIFLLAPYPVAGALENPPAQGASLEPSPNMLAHTVPIGPTDTLPFHLKYARVEEVRIVLCGTLLAVPPHSLVFQVDEKSNSFLLTDTPERLQMITAVLPAIDQPSLEKDIQRRLMEMWLRIAHFYHA